MKITVSDRNYIIVTTPNGDFHISHNGSETFITMPGHFNLLVMGKTKCKPVVVLDSDEFPTHLRVAVTEREWASFEAYVKSGEAMK